jgi:hypothetical protein
MTGERKEQCLRDERRKTGPAARGGELRGSCDMFIGLERERCLQEGGTVEAKAQVRRER